MMRSGLRGWFRLTIVLSGLWLVAIGVYAALAWRYSESIPAPFVHVRPFGQDSFDGAMFGGLAVAGFVAVWLLFLGLPWVIRGFMDGGSS
jgi:hypothetical protein